MAPEAAASPVCGSARHVILCFSSQRVDVGKIRPTTRQLADSLRLLGARMFLDQPRHPLAHRHYSIQLPIRPRWLPLHLSSRSGVRASPFPTRKWGQGFALSAKEDDSRDGGGRAKSGTRESCTTVHFVNPLSEREWQGSVPRRVQFLPATR